jgi:beta-lactamase class A
LTRTLIKYLIACGALFSLAACSSIVPLAGSRQSPQTAASPSQGCPPADLREQYEKIASVTRGPVGAAATILETGVTVALNGEQHFPMQSVYKLPIAMTVLHQVDSGALKLDQKVLVKPKDFVSRREHSIQGVYPRGAELSVRELLQFMVSESDGTACDALLRLIGGPKDVTKYLRDLGVQEIMVANFERELGENPGVSYQNWSTPQAMLQLSRILHEGKVLSAPSRDLLLKLMIESRPGAQRIKGLLPPDAIVAHKTGTSGTVNGLTSATNDVGIVTLPDGRHLALAVFVSDTKADVAENVIAKMARATWDCWTISKEPTRQ